jgi:hypothetical protein
VAEVEHRLERLRSKKEEVATSIDQRRANTRFSTDEVRSSATATNAESVMQELQKPAVKPVISPSPAAAVPDASASDEYTARLLEAKKKAREAHKKHRPDM